MKKLIMLSSLLFTSTVFADSCTFNLTFNDKWTNFKNWIIIITDVSSPGIQEVVGGPQLFYGKFPDSGTLKVPVPNCTKSTQIGLFAHAPGKAPVTDSGVLSNTNSGLKPQAYAPNSFLEGMAHCVGDINPGDLNNINLEVGSIGKPGDFAFTSKPAGSEPDSWTKAQLGVTCKNNELTSEQDNPSF
ncbi:Uncharacterised protein [Legionella wadsworthii]|uniref:Uncharacterized protein n=1 Tax=Legionella wadsworthii TaxID=28088 RepID=A0A378LV88_9GAMM|nr:hypothetical protein [Legionella wadsworthii]STY28011.1 Uncharacterised protein [Legionella wadsworthii]